MNAPLPFDAVEMHLMHVERRTLLEAIDARDRTIDCLRGELDAQVLRTTHPALAREVAQLVAELKARGDLREDLCKRVARIEVLLVPSTTAKGS